MLSATELAAMRVVQAATMTSTAVVTRIARTSDDMGGWTQSETTHSLACRIAPSANMPTASIYAGRLAEGLPWRLTVAAGADVQEGDRVTVDGRGFEVLGVMGPYTNETARVCVCAERS